MKNIYDYNDGRNELDAGFFVLALFIGAVVGAGVALGLMLIC